MTPLVSVIIPAYNASTTIAATLQSVRAQTFTDFEVWVIDDGSTDDTLARVQDWIVATGDRRFQVARYANGRQAVARNRGVARSRGELIAFLDADDLWTPDKLAVQVSVLQAHPAAGLVYSWTDCIDERGRFVRPGSHVTVSGRAAYRRLLVQNFLDNGSTPLVRRSAIAAVGPFDPTLPPVEDWDLWIKIAAQFEIIGIPLTQVFYRIAPYSSSAQVDNLARSALRVIDHAFQAAPPAWQPLKSRSLANLYEYLFFQCFSGAVRRRNAIAALPYLGQALRHDRELRRCPRAWMRALWKAIATSLLPGRLAHQALNRLGNAGLAHADLLRWIQTDPSPTDPQNTPQ